MSERGVIRVALSCVLGDQGIERGTAQEGLAGPTVSRLRRTADTAIIGAHCLLQGSVQSDRSRL